MKLYQYGHQGDEGSAEPMITIAVCTHNRVRSLKRTLDCLIRLPATADYEVLVVDNASTDGSRTLVSAMSSQWPQLRYVYEGKLGLSNALNRAVEAARGEVIAFVDDDETVAANWLDAVRDAFSDRNVGVIFGRLRVKTKGPESTRRQLRSLFPPRDYGENPIQVTEANRARFMFGTGISAYWRSTLLEMGPFRTDLGRKGGQLLGGEDTDMFGRLLKAGKTIVYWPDAVYYHHIDEHRTSLGASLKRSFYFGVNEARLDGTVSVKRLFGIPLFCVRRIMGELPRVVGGICRGTKTSYELLAPVARHVGEAYGHALLYWRLLTPAQREEWDERPGMVEGAPNVRFGELP